MLILYFSKLLRRIQRPKYGHDNLHDFRKKDPFKAFY